jgi:hypothetical protein
VRLKKTTDNGAVCRNGGCGSSKIFINFAALVLVRAAVSPATAAKPPTRYLSFWGTAHHEAQTVFIEKILKEKILIQKKKCTFAKILQDIKIICYDVQ